MAIDDLRTNKKRVITFLSDQLRRKTEELQDLEEKLEGSKQEFELEVADLNVSFGHCKVVDYLNFSKI